MNMEIRSSQENLSKQQENVGPNVKKAMKDVANNESSFEP